MRVLSVTHGPTVPGGIFDEAVVEGGHELERWFVPAHGDAPPAAAFDAVMVFGGSMHPDQDDEFAWLGREEEFLRDVLAQRVPVVGVCLGAQMLARAAGAWVGPARAREIGWLDVELTDAGRRDSVLGVLPRRIEALQWHSYAFAIPSGAAELARSTVCPQAFALDGHAWGLQFHAEVTLPMVEAWIEEEIAELPLPATRFVAETRARIAGWNELGRRMCRAFLEEAARVRSPRQADAATRSTTSLAADA